LDGFQNLSTPNQHPLATSFHEKTHNGPVILHIGSHTLQIQSIIFVHIPNEGITDFFPQIVVEIVVPLRLFFFIFFLIQITFRKINQVPIIMQSIMKSVNYFFNVYIYKQFTSTIFFSQIFSAYSLGSILRTFHYQLKIKITIKRIQN
jgi:hypothetical protein